MAKAMISYKLLVTPCTVGDYHLDDGETRPPFTRLLRSGDEIPGLGLILSLTFENDRARIRTSCGAVITLRTWDMVYVRADDAEAEEYQRVQNVAQDNRLRGLQSNAETYLRSVPKE